MSERENADKGNTRLTKAIIRWSLADVIRILESAPVRADMIPEIMIVQVVNRIPPAHLAIEKTLKFLIVNAGGEFKENHQLHSQLEKFREYAPTDAEFLDRAFAEATEFYSFNHNVEDLKHLNSLNSYLSTVGTECAFIKMRYWDLEQTKSYKIIWQAWIPLHLEILHALREILLEKKAYRNTIKDRVERQVRGAMYPSRELSYAPGTQEEEQVKTYRSWIKQHETAKEALREVVQKQFNTEHELRDKIAKDAYQTLLSSQDPAIRYFASLLNVLPKQQREAIPEVKWISDNKHHGIVQTPGGQELGEIDRSPDGIWRSTPLVGNLTHVTALAKTKTDAICYLANLLTAPAVVTTDGIQKSVRLAGDEYDMVESNYGNYQIGTTDEPIGWTHKIVFWDDFHGVVVGQQIKIDIRHGNVGQVLEGQVVDVEKCTAHIYGNDYFMMPEHDLPQNE